VTRDRLAVMLERITHVHAGVIGDFCLDAYWELDTRAPEASLETGKPTRSVRRQRYTPGGAGNVAWNLSALGAGSVCCFGVIAQDLFGLALRDRLHERLIDTDGLVAQPTDWDTPVYAKPYIGPEEQERIDFGRENFISRGTEQDIVRKLRDGIHDLHILVVNQQLVNGVCSRVVIEGVNAIVREHPRKIFVLDARTMMEEFPGMVMKLSAVQAAGPELAPLLRLGSLGVEQIAERASAISVRQGKPVFVTRNADGMLLCEGPKVTGIPAVPISGPTDPVGAGDTTVAAIALGLAAGATPQEAGELAALAAAVTVRKLRQTGTATPEEILKLAG